MKLSKLHFKTLWNEDKTHLTGLHRKLHEIMYTKCSTQCLPAHSQHSEDVIHILHCNPFQHTVASHFPALS